MLCGSERCHCIVLNGSKVSLGVASRVEGCEKGGNCLLNICLGGGGCEVCYVMWPRSYNMVQVTEEECQL